MKDIGNIEDIRLFVDKFYDKIRQDQLIGAVFLEKMPGDWQPYLNKVYSFWSAALFGEPEYKSLLATHSPLLIEQEHYDRWLNLFLETIDFNFKGYIADEVKNRVGLMAVLFVTPINDFYDSSN